jgi:hypothetical protein
MRRTNRTVAFALALAAIGAVPALASKELAKAKEAGKKLVQCDLSYTLRGWSAFYKTARGEGTVTCDNGQQASVSIRVKGGGLTFGKTDILDGSGGFTGVKDIREVFGSYAAAEAHGGAVKSGQAAVYTKGPVSLALTGTGRGMDVGIDFGKFTISPAK